MRVAVVSPLFESVPPRFYGGTERVIHYLCRGLREANVDVSLFASGDSETPARLIPVVSEALRLKKVPVQDSVPYNLRMLALVAELADEFDIIHNHHDYWMLPLTKMTGVPLLTTLHGRLDLPELAIAMQSFNSAYYVSISNSQRKPLPQLNWLRTIYHGLDIQSFQFHEKPGNYLAFLGRINPEKGPSHAIQMAKRSGIPLKIAAKIEGPDGHEYYENCIKPQIDGRFIEYVGEISEREKSKFLGEALALVFPIDWPEPFGLVMIEALACGTPVLARPFGSVPEVLRSGITGFVHPDLAVLADSIRNIHQIDRRKCRAWAESRFSYQRMTEDYLRVYRHVISEGFEPDRHRWDLLHSVQRTAGGNS